MASKPKKGKAVDKWRKKKYFTVLAPKVFQERELGQSIAYESASLKGRCIKTNLMMLTGNMKKQHINVTFKIDKVQGDTAFTMVESYVVAPSSIKRKVRRQRDRIDESFQCVTKDGKTLRIKPLIVTRIKTSRSVKTALKDKALEFMLDVIGKSDYDSLVMDIVNDKFQRNISRGICKIVPIKSVDIRVLKYLGTKKADEGTEAKETVEDKPEPKKVAPTKEEPVQPAKKEEIVETEAEPESASA